MSEEKAIGHAAEKSNLEESIRAIDLALKEWELKAKQEELHNRSRFLGRVNITASQATLVVGVLTLLGSFFGVYLQQGNQLDLKNREFKAQAVLKQREIEGQLILSAIKDQDAQQSLNRLRFLIDAGFIGDTDGRIATLILSGKYGSGIGVPSPSSVLNALASGQPPSIIREIIAISGKELAVDFQAQANFSAMAAVVKQPNGRVTLLYDFQRIELFEQDKKNNWTVAAILAHEIGHIVLGHLTIRSSIKCLQPNSESKDLPCISVEDLELACDAYAGFVLRRLGASLEEVERAFAFFPAEPSLGYPTREQRIQAIANGWRSPNPMPEGS